LAEATPPCQMTVLWALSCGFAVFAAVPVGDPVGIAAAFRARLLRDLTLHELAHFTDWCIYRGLPALPAEPGAVWRYLTALVDADNAAGRPCVAPGCARSPPWTPIFDRHPRGAEPVDEPGGPPRPRRPLLAGLMRPRAAGHPDHRHLTTLSRATFFSLLTGTAVVTNNGSSARSVRAATGQPPRASPGSFLGPPTAAHFPDAAVST
jgi:hypothetical protein